jgi:hypothetical protein
MVTKTNKIVIVSLFNLIIWVGTYLVASPEIILLSSILTSITSIGVLIIEFFKKNLILDMLSLGSLFLQIFLSLSFIVAAAHGVSLDWELLDLIDTIKVTSSSYALAMSYSMACAFFLALIACIPYIKKINQSLGSSLFEVFSLPTKTLLVLGYSVVVIEIIFLALGLIDIRGFSDQSIKGNENILPWYASIYDLVKNINIPIGVLLICKAINQKGFRLRNLFIYISAGIIMLMSIYLGGLEGRRAMLLPVILFPLYLVFYNRDNKKTLLILVSLVLLFVFMRPVFSIVNYMRWSGGNGASAITNVSDAINDFFSDRMIKEGEDVRELENLATRPLVLGVVATSMSVPFDSVKFLKGQMLINNIIWSIPRKLFPKKEDYLILENLLYEEFEDPIFFDDQADSFELYAYSEFGYFGWIIYPMIFSAAWILVACNLLIIKNRIAFILLFSIWPSYWIFNLVEGTPADFLVRFRTSIIIFALYILYVKVTKKHANRNEYSLSGH